MGTTLGGHSIVQCHTIDLETLSCVPARFVSNVVVSEVCNMLSANI